MAKVLFKRYETDAEAQASNVIDGQFIITKEGTSYTDYGTDRVAFGGTLDTQMSDSSINGVQNKVIKEYVDDGIQEAKDYVDEKQTYSTTETVIGTYLNKPLYRKVILVETTTTTHNKDSVINVPLNLLPLEFMTRFDCITKGNNGINLEINKFIVPDRYDKNNDKLTLNVTANYTTDIIAVILEYTKTTN